MKKIILIGFLFSLNSFADQVDCMAETAVEKVQIEKEIADARARLELMKKLRSDDFLIDESRDQKSKVGYDNDAATHLALANLHKRMYQNVMRKCD